MIKKCAAIFIMVVVMIFSFVTYCSALNLNQRVPDKVTDALKDEIASGVLGKYEVMIWLLDNEELFVSENEHVRAGTSALNEAAAAGNVGNSINAYRKSASEKQVKRNKCLAENILNEKEIIYISKYSPVIIASLSAGRINRIKKSDNVDKIDLYTADEVEPCTVTSEQVARVTDLQSSSSFGYTGAGVKIGVFDVGTPYASELPASCNYIASYGSYGGTHAGYCGSIIASIASDADFYFSGNVPTLEGIEWLIDKDVDIISMSLSVGGGASDMNQYTSFSRWMDHVSYQHCIAFVLSAGNYGSNGLYQAQMAYNVITVGAINYNNTLSYSDDFLSSVSSYYDGSIYASKPDICAPYGDTSSATAQTSGIIALLLEERPSLKTYPETVKAIITASVNRSSPHRYIPTYRSLGGNSYMQYGAGLIDAYLSAQNIMNNRYSNGGILSYGTEETSTFSVAQAGATVRVSLVYQQPVMIDGDHSTTSDLSSSGLANLNLEVYAPGSSVPIAVSGTSFSNVEIVQFTAPSYGTYTVKVIQATASDITVFYGIAWDIY